MSRAPLGGLPGPHLPPHAPRVRRPWGSRPSRAASCALFSCGRDSGSPVAGCWRTHWHSLAATQTLTFLCPRPAGTHRAENMKGGLVWLRAPCPRAVCRGGVQPPPVLAPSCQVTSRGAFVWRQASQRFVSRLKKASCLQSAPRPHEVSPRAGGRPACWPGPCALVRDALGGLRAGSPRASPGCRRPACSRSCSRSCWPRGPGGRSG